MSKGFCTAQDGHVVSILPPVNIMANNSGVSAGTTMPAFSMRNYSHASILVQIGAEAGAPTSIFVTACTDAAGDGATPIAFDLFAGETSNSDALGPRISVPATGYHPPATPNIFYVIEVDSTQCPSGYPYLRLQMTNGSNSVMASAIAILSGAHFAFDQAMTVLN